ncbi:MAG: redoxin domain-containing protein [Bacteroidota bacterium]
MKKFVASSLLLICFFVGFAQQKTQYTALDSLKNEKDATLLAQKILKLQSGSEANMRLLYTYYTNEGNTTKANEVLAAMVKKYPHGNAAFKKAMDSMNAEKDVQTQEKLLQQVEKDFPGKFLEIAYYTVADAYAQEKNLAKVDEYLAKIKNATYRPTAVNVVARHIMAYNPAFAEKMILPEIGQAKGDDFLNYATTYSNILAKMGRHKDALEYAKKAYDASGGKVNKLTGNYATLLSKDGQDQLAFDLLKPIVEKGQSTKEQKVVFLESYVKLNPGKDKNDYMTTIYSQIANEMKLEVAKIEINKPAPNFVVTDANGKKISLADFKGKVIVLDFWATWCAPCKESLPVMQLTADKYQKDPKVKFLFIHTWEMVADPLADAKDYFAKNKFRLDLYIDKKNPVTKVNPAVSSFGVTGIPAKFVIDGNGNIRFSIKGFINSRDDAAVAELSSMIDLAKGTL